MACRHPRLKRIYREEGGYDCTPCGAYVSPEQQRTGRTVRQYGIRAELKVARKYGGQKTNDGGPVDIVGKDFATQVKTRRVRPPLMWVRALAIMEDSGLCPRILMRYAHPGGPSDYFIFRADDFLAWFGKDE